MQIVVGRESAPLRQMGRRRANFHCSLGAGQKIATCLPRSSVLDRIRGRRRRERRTRRHAVRDHHSWPATWAKCHSLTVPSLATSGLVQTGQKHPQAAPRSTSPTNRMSPSASRAAKSWLTVWSLLPNLEWAAEGTLPTSAPPTCSLQRPVAPQSIASAAARSCAQSQRPGPVSLRDPLRP